MTGIVYIDLRKAFDTVNHDILLQKLPGFGIRNMELNWFKSYLSGRSQAVAVDGNISDTLPITVGVPQGSIFGPLLFLLYMNDLPNINESCKINMYADDTAIHLASKSPAQLESKINKDLGKVQKYFQQNKLSLNVNKCEFMLVGTAQKLKQFDSVSIKINNEPLKKVKCAKYLGMTIDENLRWGNHIDTLAKKVSQRLGILRRMKRIVPQITLKTIYNSLILPQFDYADVVYDSCTETDKDRLQRLQTKAAQILTGSKPRTHRNDMYKELKWMSLQNRRNSNKSILMYKCQNSLAPAYLTDIHQRNSDIHGYNTRSANKLRIDRIRTCYYERSFKVTGAKIWNGLPESVISKKSLNTFKNAVKEHFLNGNQF